MQDWLPDPYILILTGFGLLIALVAWLPLALKKLPLSLPIVCIALGAAVFSIPQVGLRPSPLDYPELTERFTEFVVIIALMGAGLKLDRVFRWRRWAATWRLLAITMPLSIGAIALLGAWAGLAWPIAILLGASLAPTDPVLAADVQVGPPRTGEEDEVRFGLTSEAGLNDGLAFPFVHLAIMLAASAATGEPWLWEWLGYRVFWEIGASVVAGWAIGRGVGWLTFHVPGETKLAQTGDGLIAIAATLVAYGIAEMIHSYGFLAVFVTALTLRHAHRNHDFHRDMHDVTEQIERLAMMVLLLVFGGALVSGLLSALTWRDVGVALAILLIVRPVAGLIGLLGFRAEPMEKMTIAFFGIRGVGSIYYLAYGLNHMEVSDPARMWGIMGLVVLLSILLHGLTVTPVMRALDRSQGRDPDADVPVAEAVDDDQMDEDASDPAVTATHAVAMRGA
ncbi:MAG TPA: cation:proton antiporter [Sphingomonas sp.]|jgi:NhaP-type Na+/H+ or K+/H+ antiporter